MQRTDAIMPQWYNLHTNEDGLYTVTLPETNANTIIFCRLNPNNPDNNWNNVWNQTNDIGINVEAKTLIEYFYAMKENNWKDGEWIYNPTLCKHPFRTICFKPNDEWKKDNARFAIYVFKN